MKYAKNNHVQLLEQTIDREEQLRSQQEQHDAELQANEAQEQELALEYFDPYEDCECELCYFDDGCIWPTFEERWANAENDACDCMTCRSMRHVP